MSEPRISIHAVSAKVDLVLNALDKLDTKLDKKADKSEFNKLEKKVDSNNARLWKLTAIVSVIASGLSAAAQKAIAFVSGIVPHG